MAETVTLDDFIAQTLTDIINGVRKAQEYAADVGASVADSHYDAETGFSGQLVAFDVAVTVIRGSETEGGVKVGVWGIGLGAEGHSKGSDQTVSRIQFKVPVIFPAQDPQDASHTQKDLTVLQ